jgi:hypothetical protein
MPTLIETPETDEIGMFGEIDYPHVRIYRKKCPAQQGSVLMNNLSPLHEATIVPRNEVIHLAPLHSLHTMKPQRKSTKKRAKKGKKSRKNRK